jgi:hypothetical protein
VKDWAFFGARITLSVVSLHYDGIDLQAIDEGFADGQSKEEFNALNWAATPAADTLARLVSSETVLHVHEEEL